MRIAWLYHIRSIWRRPSRTSLTLFGIALVIFSAAAMLGMARGMVKTTAGSGDPHNLMILSQGAETMEFSAIDWSDYLRIRTTQGVATNHKGDPLASPEIVINSVIDIPGLEEEQPRALVRGIGAAAFAVRPNIKLSEGRMPEGDREVVVGRLVAVKLGVDQSVLAVGKSIQFEGESWKIVGTFDAPGSILEAELWATLNSVRTYARRDDLSVIVLRAPTVAAIEELSFEMEFRTDVRVRPVPETTYFSTLAQALKPLEQICWILAGLLILGGGLVGMNTMTMNILGRIREVGMLQTMGYHRSAVALGFTSESMLLAMVGAIVGSLLSRVLDGVGIALPMGAFRFAVDGHTVSIGILLGFGIGLFGALPPLLRILRIKLVDTLPAA